MEWSQLNEYKLKYINIWTKSVIGILENALNIQSMDISNDNHYIREIKQLFNAQYTF